MIVEKIIPKINLAWIKLLEINREKIMTAGRERYKTALVPHYGGTAFMQKPNICIDSAGNLKSDVDYWQEQKSNTDVKGCIKVLSFDFYTKAEKITDEELNSYMNEYLEAVFNTIKTGHRMSFNGLIMDHPFNIPYIWGEYCGAHKIII